jgi:predicted DNA-binding ribbon-helix-helix protein
MAQPHKGDRVVTITRLVQPVHDDVRRAAAERGLSISQYIADVMAAHTGHSELVRELRQEVLPQSA